MRTIIRNTLALILALMLTISLTSLANPDPVKKAIDPVTDGTGKDSLKDFRELLTTVNKNIENAGHFDLNPKVVDYVNTYIPRVESKYEGMKDWGRPYFAYFEKTLKAYGLPVELEYLSVIESDLKSNAVSSKGAVGLWQLMDFQARDLGLKVNGKVDERKDMRKSTVAAAKLLRDLYNQFGDWLLVIAAYNAGSGCVSRAMAKAHSDNFWDIQNYLPEETKYHVKRYIATHYYFEGSGGWTTMTADETMQKKLMMADLQHQLDSLNALASTATLQIVGKYNAVAVANYLSMDVNEFNQYNPDFDKTLAAGQFYNIRLPQDKMEIFKTKRQYILQQSVEMLLAGSQPVKDQDAMLLR